MMDRNENDAREGWSYARETKFTQLMKKTKEDRQKFKEEVQQRSLDRSRQFVSEDKLDHYEKVTLLDKATGIYNHKAFMRKLEYELKRAKRYKRPVSLLIMEIDGLEKYGRQYGSMIVEDMLKSATGIIQKAIRDVDVPGRCKENRLAIIFPETYSSRAVVVGERIRERLKTQPINEELKHLRVTASVGVVSFPTHARDENDLMFKALEFLDVASQDGGDRVYNG
ncbi:diguanylate cyclase [Candidatus Obscuribacterales bacterium]|jgi:diguanylate cyclase (GGDEF)-like protein|nr:diguanylate cyclase [Candidatus Obscuribacterales bacterium]MBX3149480.1 diguanylate cyclase [Candidatus Obscuribacterales bacterium]